MPMTENDRRFIQDAALYLERPSFSMRMANLIGRPIELGLEKLPEALRKQIGLASHKALQSCLRVALYSLHKVQGASRRHAPAGPGGIPTSMIEEGEKNFAISRVTHGAATIVTGALGGAFGLAGMTLELPVSTTVILHSIASIAQGFGIDLDEPSAQLECLAVLSMGAPSEGESAVDPLFAESSYFTHRAVMAKLVTQASAFIARATATELSEALAKGSAPALVRMIGQMAARFEVVVSGKAMGQMIPLVGAGSGALINAAYTDHFTTVAKYHFGIRSLELKYGSDEVRRLYDWNRVAQA